MHPEPSVTIETITPSVAEEYLKLNDNFRTPRRNHVAFLSRLLSEGAFEFNGDSIKFKDGRLADGQHRLLACVASGVPFRAVVVRNIDSCSAIDSGNMPRSLSMYLTNRNEANANTLAAVTLTTWRTHKFGWSGNSFRGGTNYRGAMRELLAWLDANPWLRNVTKLAKSLTPLFYASVSGGCLHEFMKLDREAAEEFAASVARGYGDEADPCIMINRIMAADVRRKPRIDREHQACLMTKAWNLRRQGRLATRHLIRWRRFGDVPEAFPDPI